MGKLDVHISHGGGGIDPKVIVVGAVVLLAASGGGAIASAAASAFIALVEVLAIVVGSVVVLGIALAILFRKRIAANFRPTQVVWQSNPHADPPKTPSPAAPKQELHLHFHGDSPDAIRRAVAAAALAGGGEIRLPAGEFDMRETPVIRS